MKKFLKIQLLGNFHLTFNDDPVPGVESPRLQSFLAYLLIHRNTPLQRQQLAYLFWPDSSESQSRTNLRNLLYRLREVLPETDENQTVEEEETSIGPQKDTVKKEPPEEPPVHYSPPGSVIDKAA